MFDYHETRQFDKQFSHTSVLAQLELDFNSVERIVEYFDVPQEAPAIIENSRPPAYWPSSNGDLVVDNLIVRYAPDLPIVLRNLSFTLEPSEKIGVVNMHFTRQALSLTIHCGTCRSEGQGLGNRPWHCRC
jgi:hypothetical protein